MSIYLRLKRQNQTIFLHSEPHELVSDLKELRFSNPSALSWNISRIRRLSLIVQRPLADIRLYKSIASVLDESLTVSACRLDNDHIVPFVYRMGALHIQSFILFHFFLNLEQDPEQWEAIEFEGMPASIAAPNQSPWFFRHTHHLITRHHHPSCLFRTRQPAFDGGNKLAEVGKEFTRCQTRSVLFRLAQILRSKTGNRIQQVQVVRVGRKSGKEKRESLCGLTRNRSR